MKRKKSILLVKTCPKDMRNQNSTNLGLEIIKKICEKNGYKVDLVDYWELINLGHFFSFFYLNKYSFE